MFSILFFAVFSYVAIDDVRWDARGWPDLSRELVFGLWRLGTRRKFSSLQWPFGDSPYCLYDNIELDLYIFVTLEGAVDKIGITMVPSSL